MFITFEGLDFSGKSTQARLLQKYFQTNNLSSILIREPGGTPISEKIRQILLDKVNSEMISLTEFLLFSASRAQLIHEVIKPNLEKGNIVICDRYYDSSTAYQGYAGQLETENVNKVNHFATGNLIPDITFLIDVKPEVSLERAARRSEHLDRIEIKNRPFYEAVYNGFHKIASSEGRVKIINGSKTIEQIHSDIINIVNHKINKT